MSFLKITDHNKMDFDPMGKTVFVEGVKYSDSPNVYELFTDNKSKLTCNDLNEKEKEEYGKLVVNSILLYEGYQNSRKPETLGG